MSGVYTGHSKFITLLKKVRSINLHYHYIYDQFKNHNTQLINNLFLLILNL